MTEAKERFRNETRDAILKCAKWMEDNADSLVDEFSNQALGCKSWSLSFKFDSELFPWVEVSTDCRMCAMVDGTYRRDGF